MITALVVIASMVATVLLIAIVGSYMVNRIDREQFPLESSNLNEYEQLQSELVDTLFEGVDRLSIDQTVKITQNAAKFVTERNMAFYRNGFGNGVIATRENFDKDRFLKQYPITAEEAFMDRATHQGGVDPHPLPSKDFLKDGVKYNPFGGIFNHIVPGPEDVLQKLDPRKVNHSEFEKDE